MHTTRLYREGKRIPGEHSIETLVAHAGTPGCIAWVDLNMQEVEILDELATHLGLHQLAVEDARSKHERPKLARFDSHLLLTVSSSSSNKHGDIRSARLTAFILPGMLITVHQQHFPMEKVLAQLDDNLELASNGMSYLLWGLLDVIVDSHTNTIERLDDVIEDLSDGLFEPNPDIAGIQRTAFTLRRSVSRLRHSTMPLKEVISLLTHQGEERMSKEMRPYFADVGDHALLASEWTETLVEHITTAIETSIALQGNRMNEIMKKVTGWAAIIAVPTAITGFFGMNVDFPGNGRFEGLVASMVLAIGSSVTLYFVFRKRDWL